MADEIRSLPKNREAEQVVLGCAVVEAGTVIPLITEKLAPDHFYFRVHRLIYGTLLELFDSSQPIDLITLGNRLEEKGTLGEVGGRSYLSELASVITTTTSAPYYADIVLKKAMLRELSQIGQEIAELGYQEDEELDKLLDSAEERVFRITRQTLKQDYYALKEVLHQHLDALEEKMGSERGITGISTGYKALDRMTAGFQPTDLLVLAGRPGMGKTSFALSIARRIAVSHGLRVGLFSLEMTKEQVAERLLCSEARLNLLALRGGYVPAAKWREIMDGANRLNQADIFIDDTPAISVMELKAKARRMKMEHDIDLLIVDYLQLIEGGARVEVREQEIAYISRSLKGLARELRVPVIALSQLSRAVEHREDKRPRLSDLRESGSLEQEADVVLFIYREDYYKRKRDQDELEEGGGHVVEGGDADRDSPVVKAELIVGKQRNGPTGSFELLFHRHYATFEERELRRTPSYTYSPSDAP